MGRRRKKKRRLKARHVRFAKSSKHHAAHEFSSNPTKALANEMREAQRLGVKIVYKVLNFGKWLTYSTTFLRWGIRLSPEWKGEQGFGKARHVRHELVHSRQWRGLGRALFGFLYAIAEWRWAIEMQAFREDVKATVQAGVNKADVLEYVEERISDLSLYSLGRLDQEHMEETTRELLTAMIDAG